MQLGFQSTTSAATAVSHFLLLGIHVRDLTAEVEELGTLRIHNVQNADCFEASMQYYYTYIHSHTVIKCVSTGNLNNRVS